MLKESSTESLFSHSKNGGFWLAERRNESTNCSSFTICPQPLGNNWNGHNFLLFLFLPSNISQCSIQGRRIWSANHIYRLRQHFFRSSITSRYLRWLPPPSHHLHQKKLLKIFKQDALRNCQKVQLWSVKLDKFNDSFFAKHSHIRYKHFNWFAFFKAIFAQKKTVTQS